MYLQVIAGKLRTFQYFPTDYSIRTLPSIIDDFGSYLGTLLAREDRVGCLGDKSSLRRRPSAAPGFLPIVKRCIGLGGAIFPTRSSFRVCDTELFGMAEFRRALQLRNCEGYISARSPQSRVPTISLRSPSRSGGHGDRLADLVSGHPQDTFCYSTNLSEHGRRSGYQVLSLLRLG